MLGASDTQQRLLSVSSRIGRVHEIDALQNARESLVQIRCSIHINDCNEQGMKHGPPSSAEPSLPDRATKDGASSSMV